MVCFEEKKNNSHQLTCTQLTFAWKIYCSFTGCITFMKRLQNPGENFVEYGSVFSNVVKYF